MYWVEIRFVNKNKERWEGLTHEQADYIFHKACRRQNGEWYIRSGEQITMGVG